MSHGRSRGRRLLAVGVALGVGLTLPATAPAAADPADGPVFSDGMAQPVFSPDDALRENVWVETTVDSDDDGRRDRVHVEVVRPGETESDDLDVPVVSMVSPYFGGWNDVTNHDVDVPLHEPGRPGVEPERNEEPDPEPGQARLLPDSSHVGPGPISSVYEDYFLARGFAVAYVESVGSGESEGCPTTGGPEETAAAVAAVDWLNGRTPAWDASGDRVAPDWTTGKVGMIGTSYNGTLPNAAASTGVEGLEAIVPIAAISSWYDYYRADGAVVAPGGYQGEDADVLAEFVLTRENPEVCDEAVESLRRRQDRVTGDYSSFWDARSYLDDVDDVHAAVLVAHGLNDWNVKTKQAAQWYEALRAQGVPHKIWWHQSGHTDPRRLNEEAWLRDVNRWFTRYVYGVQNGVEHEPRAVIQREDGSWTREAEWPAPGTAEATVHPTAGGDTAGGLSMEGRSGAPVVETLVDDASVTAEELASAPSSPHRLSYRTGPLSESVRVSGTVDVDVRVSFSEPAANVTALLVDVAPDGSTSVVTRGWTDPQNRIDDSRTSWVKPGTPYRLDLSMQPDDYVFEPGHRLGVVLLSSDHDFTLRPPPGTELHVDVDKTSVHLPVVGGPAALADATRP